MPQQVALLLFVGLIVWLFAVDRKVRGPRSRTLWVPLLWVLILGSKSPSTWIAVLNRSAASADGSTLDTVVFMGLLMLGLRILIKRKVNWGAVFSRNKWLIFYFCYAGISVLWGQDAISALKQWIKDCGNVVMVLVVLTEENPPEAVKGLLLRTGYVLVIVSLLLVKYYPALGRVYAVGTYQPRFIGVSVDKNALGATLLVCALGLFWSLFDLPKAGLRNKKDYYLHWLMIGATIWLLVKSHSATSLACTMLGLGVFLSLKMPAVRLPVHRMGLAVFIVVPLLALFLQYVVNIGEALVWTVGRDLTLTSRTRIWSWCLQMHSNPLIGAGYCNFWKGPRAKAISEGIGFFYVLSEAHNGYLETYLNCGLVGIGLLLGGVAAGAKKILAALATTCSFQRIKLTFLVVALIYNISEAAFNGLNQIWFALLLVIVDYPAPRFAPQRLEPARAPQLKTCAPGLGSAGLAGSNS